MVRRVDQRAAGVVVDAHEDWGEDFLTNVRETKDIVAKLAVGVRHGRWRYNVRKDLLPGPLPCSLS